MNNIGSKEFYVIGLNYKKADVTMRSSFSLSKEKQQLLLDEVKKTTDIKGTVVISTCNRIEIIGFADHPYRLISLLCKYSKGKVEDFAEHSYIYKNREAAEHVIRIATGIESQILGDYEIVSQLKDAFQQSKDAGTSNAYIDRLFSTALQASKEVKNKTTLSSGTTTVSYAAIQYIKDHYQDLDGKNILVFGLGDIGLKTAKSCVSYLSTCNTTVINRTDSKSFELANQTNVKAELHSNLVSEAKKADFIVVATSASEPTLLPEHLDKEKKQLIIDLSIPRNAHADIDSMEMKQVIDVDLLSNQTEQTLENRKQQIPLVEEIIDKHKTEFFNWLHFRKSTPAINSFKQYLETVQHETIDNYSKKHANFDETQLEDITSQMVKKIVSKFAKHLKEDNSQAIQSIKVMSEIFNVDFSESKHE